MDRTINERINYVHERLRKNFDKLTRIAIAIYDQHTDKIKTFVHSTDGKPPLSLYEAKLSETPSLQHIVETRQARVLDNLCDQLLNHSEHSRKVLEAGYESSYTEPLYFNEHFIGFLFCNSKEIGYFDEAIRAELSAYAQILAGIIAVEFISIQTFNGALITARTFGRYRDEETANHLHRMSSYSRVIAKLLAADFGLSDEKVEFIYLFSELHDIGKIAVPDSILLKPGKLTIEEFEVMKTHTVKGRDMINLMINEFSLDGLYHIEMLKNIINYHHERFDGKGCPEGLKGDEIPLEARIVTVADVLDALTSKRPYKDAWSFEDAFTYLENNAGHQFDPQCVMAVLNNKSEFFTIHNKYID